MNGEMKAVYEKEFAFTDNVTEEVTTVKYRIKIILEFFRYFFSADACYLYLLSVGMDEDEKKRFLLKD
jgi:hypothetical protein